VVVGLILLIAASHKIGCIGVMGYISVGGKKELGEIHADAQESK